MNILGLAHHGLNNFEQIAVLGVIVVAIISLVYAWLLKNLVMKKDKGEADMQVIWDAIRVGADSYLSRQLKTILPAIALLTLAMFFSVYVVKPSQEAVDEFGRNAQLIVAIGRTVAFIMGAVFSLLVGQLGMRMAIQANVRVAAASRKGFNEVAIDRLLLWHRYRHADRWPGIAGWYDYLHYLWTCGPGCTAWLWLWRYFDCPLHASGWRYLYQSSGCGG